MARKKTSLEKVMKRDKANTRIAQARDSIMLQTDAKRAKALDLRLSHKTYSQIAQEMGLNNASEAYKLVHAEWEALLAANTSKATIVRSELDLIIQEGISRWAPLAMSEDLNVGEKRLKKSTGEEYDVSLSSWEASAKAQELLCKLLEQRAKIHGLNLTKIEVKDDRLASQMYETAINTMRQLADKMKQKTIKAELIEQ